MTLEISSGRYLLNILFPSQFQRKSSNSNIESTSIWPVSQDEPSIKIENEKADLVLLTKIYQYFMNDYYSTGTCNDDEQKYAEPLYYEEWEFIDKLFDEWSPFPRNEAEHNEILFLIKVMEGFGLEALADATELMKSKEKLINPECGIRVANDPNNNYTKLIILIEDAQLTEDHGKFCTVAQILTIGLLACQIKPYLIPCCDIDYVAMNKILSLDKETEEVTQADQFRAYTKLIQKIFEEAFSKEETPIVILDMNPNFIETDELRAVAIKSGYPVLELGVLLFNESLKRKKVVRGILHCILNTLSKQKLLHRIVKALKDEWQGEIYPANKSIPDVKDFKNFNYNELLETRIVEKKESFILLKDESMEEFLKKENARHTVQDLQFTNVPEHFVKYEKIPQPPLICRIIQQCISLSQSFCHLIQHYICSCCSVSYQPKRELRTGVFLYDKGDDLV